MKFVCNLAGLCTRCLTPHASVVNNSTRFSGTFCVGAAAAAA